MDFYYNEAKYNRVAEMLSDNNAYPGIDMVRFGDTIDEYIEIVSPGGLPTGLSENEYVDGQISLLRNPILGNVFFRLLSYFLLLK